jgi:glycosyltransferase involved in cell wall biosynthesis
MTVFFTSANDQNPYHQLLFKHLEQNGVDTITLDVPLFLPLTRSVLKNNNIDVIHIEWLYHFYLVHNYTSLSSLDAIITFGRTFWFCVDFLLIKLIGPQIVWTVHNKYHHERHYHRTESLLNIFVANLVDDITVKCESARETIVPLYRIRDRSKITVIPDGNYIDAYPNQVTRTEARERLSLDDEFMYLFFGKIRPYKGVNTLIEEFRQIDTQERTLWVVGNPKNESIAERVESNASRDSRIETRLEFVPSDEVQVYLNAADVLVLPYNDILNSGSVHLGLSFGLPMIAPRLGCIPEAVPISNLLYDPQDDDGLRSKLLDTVQFDLKSVRTANQKRARSLTWEKAGSRYREVYEQ